MTCQRTAAQPEQSHLGQGAVAGQQARSAPSGLITAGQPSCALLPLCVARNVNLGHQLQASADRALNRVPWTLNTRVTDTGSVGLQETQSGGDRGATHVSGTREYLGVGSERDGYLAGTIRNPRDSP